MTNNGDNNIKETSQINSRKSNMIYYDSNFLNDNIINEIGNDSLYILDIDLSNNKKEKLSINKNNVTEKLKDINIKSYWRDIVKDPETSFILMIVDPSGKNDGNKRKSILDPNLKYIGICSVKIGKSFCCYLTFSNHLI